MKSILILTAYVIHKTTECRLSVEKKLTEKVVFIRRKSDGVWLGACAKGLTAAVVFENETMNAEIYINEVLPIALECGDKTLGSS